MISQGKLLMCISWCRYSSKFVKGYIEASKPRLAVGEYWDTCNYVGPKYTLDYNQGWCTLIFHLTIVVFNFWTWIISFWKGPYFHVKFSNVSLLEPKLLWCYYTFNHLLKNVVTLTHIFLECLFLFLWCCQWRWHAWMEAWAYTIFTVGNTFEGCMITKTIVLLEICRCTSATNCWLDRWNRGPCLCIWLHYQGYTAGEDLQLSRLKNYITFPFWLVYINHSEWHVVSAVGIFLKIDM